MSEPKDFCAELRAGALFLDGHDYTSDLLERAADEVEVMRTTLEQIAKYGEDGMPPNYSEWLAFHDTIARLARRALGQEP